MRCAAPLSGSAISSSTRSFRRSACPAPRRCASSTATSVPVDDPGTTRSCQIDDARCVNRDGPIDEQMHVRRRRYRDEREQRAVSEPKHHATPSCAVCRSAARTVASSAKATSWMSSSNYRRAAIGSTQARSLCPTLFTTRETMYASICSAFGRLQIAQRVLRCEDRRDGGSV